MKRKPKAKPVQLAWCSRCRGQMPVGHVCPSGNQADLAHGRRAVVSVRFDRRTRERLEVLVEKRALGQRWPRPTASGVVLEAVTALLDREGV